MALLLAAAPPSPPPELTQAEATGVLSRMVLDENGREIGRIVDVVVDPTGAARAIVIDVGGFMGVGSRRVAVAWNAVHVPPPGAPDPRVNIDMTDEQVRDAPAYNDRSKPATIVGPASQTGPDTTAETPAAAPPASPTVVPAPDMPPGAAQSPEGAPAAAPPAALQSPPPDQGSAKSPAD